jgi:gamma-glutamyl-gamma-aminobutyrate hydrolase PuuD
MKRILTVAGDTGDPAPYKDALREVGVEAVFGESLDGVAGLLLMGGTDVNPALYGEERHPETEDPDDKRDRLETVVIGEALERDLPILAICRGMQMLNVQHGGTLIQHLDTVERHRQRPQDKSLNAHCIEITPGRELARIAGSELTRKVNSRHHQSVARVGEGLVVSARDPKDQVIEAIERPDKRFVVGVEWHPENQMAVKDGIARRLFEAFAAAL